MILENTIKMPIAGYEGLYEVHSNGDIYSMPRFGTRGGLLIFTPDRFGYLRVGLCKGNKVKMVKSHRIVATTFIPNPESKPCVNHINGIKTDNRVENLEWVTYQENVRHSWGIGKSKALKGTFNGNSKVSDEERLQIVTMYAQSKFTQKEIANKFKMTQSNVSMIVKQFIKNILDEGLATAQHKKR